MIALGPMVMDWQTWLQSPLFGVSYVFSWSSQSSSLLVVVQDAVVVAEAIVHGESRLVDLAVREGTLSPEFEACLSVNHLPVMAGVGEASFGGSEGSQSDDCC